MDEMAFVIYGPDGALLYDPAVDGEISEANPLTIPADSWFAIPDFI